VPDTPANRDAFGSAGTADGPAPYPQLRELRCPVASTRATAGVVTGPSGTGGGRGKGEAGQKLLDGALARYPGIFTPDRLWAMESLSSPLCKLRQLLSFRYIYCA
jgi:hypothetical protein